MNKSRIMAIIGIILVVLQAIVSCMALYRVVRFDILPGKYIAAMVILMFVAIALVVVMQFFHIVNIVGKVLSVLVSAVMIFVFVAVGKAERTINEGMQAGDTVQIAMEVMALKTNNASDIKEFGSGVFGITKDESSYEHDKQVIGLIEKELGHEVAVKEYSDNFTLSKALLSGEVDILIINSAYVSTLEEAYETLEEGDEYYLGLDSDGQRVTVSSKMKTITTYNITVKSQTTGGIGVGSTDRTPINTSITPFVIYISGIDVKGDISTVSRSDVNVIVCVNPVTKQILMVTTPRDSYVEIPGKTDNSTQRDKLTHAGLYGSGCSYSIATLENIYGVDIDYYLRVNFTSVVDIVDLLGGVTVYSEHEFVGRHGKFQFYKGYNEMNGEQALSFARERFTIAGGDYSRGRNHMELIKGVLNKAMSPAILANYSQLLDLAADNIETNMTSEEITEIVKMQLNDGATWNFISYATSGINDGDQEMRYCWSYSGSRLYVTILDEESVAKASDLMARVLNGEILQGDEVQ
ncbi:MAG: LCP family protein [Lachnospiraceae bacterium]